MNRISRDELLILQAMLTSLRSTCGRRQVGAILAIDGRIISSGYAGAPSGMPHCSLSCLQASNALGGCTRTAHAEANAIAYAARRGLATEGATCYTTLSPCPTCAKSLINAGIVRVVYAEEYRDPSGIELLRQAGITCEMNHASFANYINPQSMFASGETEIQTIEFFSSVKPPERPKEGQGNLFKDVADNF